MLARIVVNQLWRKRSNGTIWVVDKTEGVHQEFTEFPHKVFARQLSKDARPGYRDLWVTTGPVFHNECELVQLSRGTQREYIKADSIL